MIEVRMISTSAGPAGVLLPRKVYQVDDAEAMALVKGGFAEFATIRPPEKAVTGPSEAEIKEAEENRLKSEAEAKAKADQEAQLADLQTILGTAQNSLDENEDDTKEAELKAAVKAAKAAVKDYKKSIQA